MAVELVDMRLKITLEAHCALMAYAKAHDVDKFDLARDLLHKWAMKQIHGATVLGSCLRAKGLVGASERITGQIDDGLTWDDA